jgi:probable rRNA maturation factor
LSSEGVKKPGELTICFVDDKKIRELNLKFLGRNRATDVLTFDISSNNKAIFADVIISTDTASRNARIFKSTPLRELYLYVVHGVLHILGYKDETTGQRKIMEEKARRVLTLS